MSVVFYEGTAPEATENQLMRWNAPQGALPSVVELFSDHERTACNPCKGGQECPGKFGPGFSPVALRKPHRQDVNVESVSMLVFDIDKVTRAELEAVCDRLEGLESLIVSSHSHLSKGPDHCCVRIILPLERALAPDQWRHVHREVRKRYGLEWMRPGGVKLSGADQTAVNDPSRFYFLPNAPIGIETIVGHESGIVLDLNELLQSHTPEAPRPPQPPSFPRPPNPQAAPVSTDMEALRQLLREYRPQWRNEEGTVIPKKELARRIATGEALTRPEETGERDKACLRIGKILAHCLPPETSVEALLELVRPSVMLLPIRDDDGPKDSLDERFAKIEKSWRAGLVSRAAKKAELDAKRAEDAKLSEGFKQRFKFKAPEPEPKSTTKKSKKKVKDDEKPEGFYDGWETQLRMKKNKDGSDGTALQNIDSNAETILSYDPIWRGIIRYDEVTKEVGSLGTPLETHEEDPAQLTVGVKYWLQREYGLDLGTGDVQAAILHVAKRYKYNPLEEYLTGLEWEGDELADIWLEKYCGVESNALNKRISRRWLISAVARALDPGCKVDTMLIFEGGQGIKKSTMLKVMGGEWFCDSKINIDHNDAKMIAGVNWIIEMPELAALHSSETESQKAFLSSATDKFRPPYGRVIEKFKRRCVFVGSTNDERYMNDPTGNRRYWATRCGKFDIRGVKRDRDQIWAHAVAIYQAGFTCQRCLEEEERCPEHRWWFDEAENQELEEANNQRLKSEYAGAIVHHLLKLAKPSAEKKLSERHESYTMYEIAAMLGITTERVVSQQVAIGRALKALGFEKTRPKIGGQWQPWRHVVPKELMDAPQKGSAEDFEQERKWTAEREEERRKDRHLRAVPDPDPEDPAEEA